MKGKDYLSKGCLTSVNDTVEELSSLQDYFKILKNGYKSKLVFWKYLECNNYFLLDSFLVWNFRAYPSEVYLLYVDALLQLHTEFASQHCYLPEKRKY